MMADWLAWYWIQLTDEGVSYYLPARLTAIGTGLVAASIVFSAVYVIRTVAEWFKQPRH